MAENQLINPGFELGDTDWEKISGSTIEKDAANARSGSWVNRSDFGEQGVRSIKNFAVRPGLKITISAWFKHTSNFNAPSVVALQWRDKDGAIVTNVSGNSVAAGSTAYAESKGSDLVAPARAKKVEIILDPDSGNVATAGTAWADDASLTGEVIQSLPASAVIQSSKINRVKTTAAFSPLIGSTIFNNFNAGKSDKWSGVYNFAPDIGSENLGELLGWLARVENNERFFAFDPKRKTPKNGVVNGMVVDGASQTGNSINVKSGPVSSTALVAGDDVEVRDQYFRLTRDLEIGPEGTGIMYVWPAIRTSPADGEDVITDNPKMVARITSPVPEETSQLTQVSISWEEWV